MPLVEDPISDIRAPSPDAPDDEEDETELPVSASDTPNILASPDAPSTSGEEDRAIPQSQAGNPLDILRNRPGGGRPGNSNPPGGGGGGLPPTSIPRPSSGSDGGGVDLFQGIDLSGLGGGGSGGYGGIVGDVECRRDNDGTHEDCPDYIPNPEGRDADGWEVLDGYMPNTTDGALEYGLPPNSTPRPSSDPAVTRDTFGSGRPGSDEIGGRLPDPDDTPGNRLRDLLDDDN